MICGVPSDVLGEPQEGAAERENGVIAVRHGLEGRAKSRYTFCAPPLMLQSLAEAYIGGGEGWPLAHYSLKRGGGGNPVSAGELHVA